MSECLQQNSRGTLSTTAQAEGEAPCPGAALTASIGVKCGFPDPPWLQPANHCAELNGQNGRCMCLCGRGAVLLRTAMGRAIRRGGHPRHWMRSRSGADSRCRLRSEAAGDRVLDGDAGIGVFADYTCAFGRESHHPQMEWRRPADIRQYFHIDSRHVPARTAHHRPARGNLQSRKISVT
jgi:hypothetical protein